MPRTLTYNLFLGRLDDYFESLLAVHLIKRLLEIFDLEGICYLGPHSQYRSNP